jgi:hypothetical protein
MADCSFASKIKLVPSLYLSVSSFEYYDWDDAMEDFLWGHGLESRMKIFFQHALSLLVCCNGELSYNKV